MKDKVFISKQQLVRILLGLLLFLTINTFLMDIIRAEEQTEIAATNKTFEMVPFYWTVGIIGGVIGLTLAYVSWRKYRAEQKEQTKKSKS